MGLKKILIRAGLIFGGVLLSLILLEITLRIMGFSKAQEMVRGYQVADPVLGYDLAKNYPPYHYTTDYTSLTAWSNNIGCFDDDYRGQDYSILMVGDSFTWGFAPFGERWSDVLASSTGQTVLKCGVGGYGTIEENYKAQKVIKETGKKPKLIVVGYFANDVDNDYLFPETTVIDGYSVTRTYMGNPASDTIVRLSDSNIETLVAWWEQCNVTPNGNILMREVMCWMKQHTVLFNVLRLPVKNAISMLFGNQASQDLSRQGDTTWSAYDFALTPPDTYPWLKDAWQANLNAIAAFKKYADDNGIKILFVIIPAKEELYPNLRKLALTPISEEGYDTILKPFLEKNGIPYLELLPLLAPYASKENLYWNIDNHWNPAGQKLGGLLTSQYIVEHGMVPMTPSTTASIEKQLTTELSVL